MVLISVRIIICCIDKIIVNAFKDYVCNFYIVFLQCFGLARRISGRQSSAQQRLAEVIPQPRYALLRTYDVLHYGTTFDIFLFVK